MRINRELFWKQYREKFVGKRTLTQLEVDGVNYFLDRFEIEKRLKNLPQFSYVLATAYHESGKPKLVNGKKVMVRFQPVKEGRESASSPRRANQDRYWGTGYYGRGFPQTTWKENYLKSGKFLGLGDLFVREPDLLLQKEYAYDAMDEMMSRGEYRKGKSLNKFLPSENTSFDTYTKAREIINGDIEKNGAMIAQYAVDFDSILKSSISTEPITDDVATLDTPAQSPANISVEHSADSENTELSGGSDSGKAEEFNPENAIQYIPKITAARNWLGGLTVTGFLSTLLAKLADAPQWFIFVLGILTGMALMALVWLFISYYRQIFSLVARVIQINADPAQNNVTLVSDRRFQGGISP